MRLWLARLCPPTCSGELTDHPHRLLGRRFGDGPADDWCERTIRRVLLHRKETGNEVHIQIRPVLEHHLDSRAGKAGGETFRCDAFVASRAEPPPAGLDALVDRERPVVTFVVEHAVAEAARSIA